MFSQFFLITPMGVQNYCLFCRHGNSVDLSVKEDTLEILLQGQSSFVFLSLNPSQSWPILMCRDDHGISGLFSFQLLVDWLLPFQRSSPPPPSQLQSAKRTSTLLRWASICFVSLQRPLRIYPVGRLSSQHPERYSYLWHCQEIPCR